MPVDTPKGDIRDLYAYYRFSDHKLTNIVFKDKTLFKSDVWFEGFMDWSFKRCTFTKSFYFGVEGEKLEEDTRGSEGSSEPFPPYGSNGLNFDECTMTKPFEIKDNCVAVFKDCTFSDTLTIEDNCKVEFIGCTFTKGITLKTFCDIRFIRCTLGMTDFGMNIEAHCKVEIHNCTHGSVDDYWFSVTEDCQVMLRSAEGVALAADKNTIEVDDYSEVKVYGYTSVTSGSKDVITLTGSSKFDAFDVPQFSAEKGIVFNLTDSFLFLKDCATCSCGATGQVINSTNSEIRVKDTNAWSSTQNDCVYLSNSKMFLDTFSTIHSDDGRGIVLLDGSEAIFDVGETIDSAQNMAIVSETGSVGTFKSVNLIQSGQNTAIYLLTNSWLKLYDVVDVIAQVTAINASDSRVTDNNGARRQGTQFGIEADSSIMEFSNVVDVIGIEESAAVLNNSTYDFRSVTNMIGKKSGLKVANGKGVLHNTTWIFGELEAACILEGCSGPTEWENVTTIQGELDSALKVTGDLEIRVSTIGDIISEMGVALLWQQTGGNAWVSSVQKIESLEESAADITVSAGSFRTEDVQLITSLQKLALNVTVASGEAHFERVYSVLAEQEDAMNIAVSEGALLRYNEFNDITSEMGNALLGTCDGDLLIANGDTITTQMGQAVDLTGSGLYSFARVADIGTIESQTPPTHLFRIQGVQHVQVHRIGEFSMESSASGYLCYLRGTSPNYGRCEVIDCLGWSGSDVRGGLYMRDWLHAEAVCSREKGTMSFEKATGIVLGLVNANGRVANWSEIKDESGEGLYALMIYGASATPDKAEVWNVDTIEGNTALWVNSTGVVNVHNVGEMKSPNGDGPVVEVGGSGEVRIQSGSSGATRISGKDTSVNVFLATQLNHLVVMGVDTEAGKGNISITDVKKASFYDCDLQGSIKVDQESYVEFFRSKTTSGYDVTDSVMDWTLCDIIVGEADGETKTLDTSECAVSMKRCQLRGSEDMTFTNTDVLMMHVSGSGFSGKASFLYAGDLLLGADLSGASEVFFGATTGAVVLGSGFPNTDVSGGVLTAGCSMEDISISQGALISMKDRFDALDVGDDCAFLGNGSYLTTTLDTGTDVGIILNRTFVTGALTIGNENGFLANWLESASGISNTGDDTGFLANRMKVDSDITIGDTSAFLANQLVQQGNITGVAGAGILLNRADVDGDVLATGADSGLLGTAMVLTGDLTVATGASAVVAGLSTSSAIATAGSAIFVGADNLPEGAGQALTITGEDQISTYISTLDGECALRTGMFMDSKAIHIFNQYGHTGFSGDGSSLALGVKATGTMDGPQWAPSLTGMTRSGVYIIDLAQEIHHNLPGQIE